MKLILSFLLSFSFIFCLTAQTSSLQTIISGSIFSGKFIQNESFYADASYSSIRDQYEYLPNLRHETNRLMISLEIIKLNEKMNRFAVGIFGGKHTWERGTVVFIEDEALELAVGIPLFSGSVDQYTFGANVTQSYCVNKMVKTDFRVYLGARAEGMYTYGDYGVNDNIGSTDLDVRQTYRHQIDVATAFVPELAYYFPNNKLVLSAALHLPMLSVDISSITREATNQSQTDEKDSFTNLEMGNWGASRLEFGFGWIL